jgi:hypothetical protein
MESSLERQRAEPARACGADPELILPLEYSALTTEWLPLPVRCAFGQELSNSTQNTTVPRHGYLRAIRYFSHFISFGHPNPSRLSRIGNHCCCIFLPHW